MVKSKLDPKIDYPDNSALNKSDENITSQAWYYNLDNNNIIIAVGVVWEMNDDIATVPIYLISSEDDKVIKQIGLFEMSPEKYKNSLETDEDGDEILNINKLDAPLIYDIESLKQEGAPEEKEISSVSSVLAPQDNPVVSPLVNPVVTPLTSRVVSLPEQTKEMSAAEYVKNPTGDWINKYLNSSHFRIEDVKSDGSCFFYVVRDAMNSVGNKYTIADLREKLLSYPKLEDTYNTERKIIKDAVGVMKLNEKVYNECTALLKGKTVKTAKDKKAYKTKCDEITRLVDEAKEILEPFKAIQDIDTFEEYKAYVLKHKCWATEWSMQHIENTLNIKVIIFNNEKYKQQEKMPAGRKVDQVINCMESEVTNPQYYILANYINENHYQLIYFKDVLAFKFNQLPYMLRSKILTRCIVGNKSSSWNKLVDFKGMKESAPKKKTAAAICKGLSEEECKKREEDCNYRKGTERQYCAKKPTKK